MEKQSALPGAPHDEHQLIQETAGQGSWTQLWRPAGQETLVTVGEMSCQPTLIPSSNQALAYSSSHRLHNIGWPILCMQADTGSSRWYLEANLYIADVN
jgi:hypothetical protein